MGGIGHKASSLRVVQKQNEADFPPIATKTAELWFKTLTDQKCLGQRHRDADSDKVPRCIGQTVSGCLCT